MIERKKLLKRVSESEMHRLSYAADHDDEVELLGINEAS